MATATETLRIAIEADTSGAKNGLRLVVNEGTTASRKIDAAAKRAGAGVSQATRKATRGVTQLGNSFKAVTTAAATLRRTVLPIGGALAALGAGVGISSVVRGSIEAASAIEGYEVRLRALLGSQEEANIALESFVTLSAETPFAIDQIVAGATTLSSVAQGNRKLLEDLTKTTANLAAVTGLSFQNAAGNLQRSLAGGLAAADLFRERGVRALIESVLEIPDATKLSGQQTVNAFLAVFGPNGQFGSAARELSKTLGGAISNTDDAFTRLKIAIGEAASPVLVQFLTGSLIPAFDKLTRSVENNEDSVRSWFELFTGGTSSVLRFFEFLESTGANSRRTYAQLDNKFRDFVRSLEQSGGPVGDFAKSLGLAKDEANDFIGRIESIIDTQERIGDIQIAVLGADEFEGPRLAEELATRFAEANLQAEKLAESIDDLPKEEIELAIKLANEEISRARSDLESGFGEALDVKLRLQLLEESKFLLQQIQLEKTGVVSFEIPDDQRKLLTALVGEGFTAEIAGERRVDDSPPADTAREKAELAKQAEQRLQARRQLESQLTSIALRAEDDRRGQLYQRFLDFNDRILKLAKTDPLVNVAGLQEINQRALGSALGGIAEDEQTALEQQEKLKQATVDRIRKALAAATKTIEDDVVEIRFDAQAQIDQLEFSGLDEQQKAKLAEAINQTAELKIESLRKEGEGVFEGLADGAEDAFSRVGSALAQMVQDGKVQFDQLGVAFLQSVVQKVNSGIANIGGELVGQLGKAALGGIIGLFALGGRVQGGQTVVAGEQRPEVYVPGDAVQRLSQASSASARTTALEGVSQSRLLGRAGPELFTPPESGIIFPSVESFEEAMRAAATPPKAPRAEDAAFTPPSLSSGGGIAIAAGVGAGAGSGPASRGAGSAPVSAPFLTPSAPPVASPGQLLQSGQVGSFALTISIRNSAENIKVGGIQGGSEGQAALIDLLYQDARERIVSDIAEDFATGGVLSRTFVQNFSGVAPDLVRRNG